MKTMGLRRLYQEAPSLTEEVWVVQGGMVIGTYTPVLPLEVREGTFKEAYPMEEPVKKAIEPEKVKVVERPGKEPKLTKGLGDIDGLEGKPVVPGQGVSGGTFGYSRPAPKPGKK